VLRKKILQIRTNQPLAPLTTFKVPAKADRYVSFASEEEVTGFLSKSGLHDQKYLILGGGSNLLFLDDFHGTILHPLLKGIHILAEDKQHVLVRAMAGEIWDDLVAFAVANGWGGIENLSLIPGNVGACPIQNIGAYGVEVKDWIHCVEAIDITAKEKVAFRPHDCGFGYRSSHFKGKWKKRYLITAVIFRLSRKPKFVTHYPKVEEMVRRSGSVNLESVRQAIIVIRRQKLPDPTEMGNAGSFFKNPIISEKRYTALKDNFPQLPAYHLNDGNVKLPAGWLIEKCGWKGRSLGRAAVHSRQALVLLNLGGANGQEIFVLSERIRESVWDTFAIDLKREVQVISS
jgi:UDP-N-acetylmuramate dehydrogenase